MPVDTLSKTLPDTPLRVLAEFPPGTRLGAHVVIVRPIGRGGMGMVYLAEDVALKRKVAVKILPATDDPVARGRFLREARFLAGVDGDFFVRVHDFGEEPAAGTLYFVMDACLLSRDEVVRVCREILDCPPPIPESAGDRWRSAGDGLAPLTLGDVLAGDRALKPEVVARLGLRIVDALERIHSANPPIVHRDLKPSNLLFTPSGRLLISDFGIAKSLHPAPEEATTLTMPGLGPGTPLYAAPEQKSGGEITPATDYYALGLILYRMLSGGLPSAASTALPADISGRVSPRWNRLFAQLLDRDPERRLSDPVEVRRRLGSLVRRPRRTRFALFASILFLAVAAVAATSRLRPAPAPSPAPPAPPAESHPPPAVEPGEAHPVIPKASVARQVSRAKKGTVDKFDYREWARQYADGLRELLAKPLAPPVPDADGRITVPRGMVLLSGDIPGPAAEIVLDGGRLSFSPSARELREIVAKCEGFIATAPDGAVAPPSLLPKLRTQFDNRIVVTGNGGYIDTVDGKVSVVVAGEVKCAEGIGEATLSVFGLSSLTFLSDKLDRRIKLKGNGRLAVADMDNGRAVIRSVRFFDYDDPL